MNTVKIEGQIKVLYKDPNLHDIAPLFSSMCHVFDKIQQNVSKLFVNVQLHYALHVTNELNKLLYLFLF